MDEEEVTTPTGTEAAPAADETPATSAGEPATPATDDAPDGDEPNEDEGGEEDGDSDEDADGDGDDADSTLAEFNGLLATALPATLEEGGDDADADGEDAPDQTSVTAIGTRWADLKAKIEANWEGMEATDNERLLVELLDSIVPVVAEAGHYTEQVRQAELVREANGYYQAAEAAATELAKRGVTVTGVQLLGLAQNGGLAAFASLEGKPYASYRGKITPETYVQIFELKFRKELSKLGATSAKKTTAKAPKPLSAGGGAPEKKQPTNAMEAFRAARLEGKAKAAR